MAPIQFKLSKPDGLTRRLTFQGVPTWVDLAAKISGLYSIPSDKLGVSYIDTDGDEVTLSSQEELEDFYQASYQPPQAIKFVVQDLRSLREAHVSASNALPETPRTSVHTRNTFGGFQVPLTFEVDGEWEKLGGLPFLRPESDRFIELAASVSNGSSDSDAESVEDVQEGLNQDKGKYKAYQASVVSSTGSVLAENTPRKHPVHVYDRSNQNIHSSSRTSSRASTFCAVPSVPLMEPNQTAPQNADAPETNKDNSPLDTSHTATAAGEQDAADPPLPSLDQSTNPSLTNDVADLFTALTNIFTLNPDLTEKLRIVVENARNGVYWTAHREAIARAADEVTRTAPEIRRNVEEEAGRRVAEALGGILRAFGDGSSGPASAETSAAISVPSTSTPAPKAPAPLSWAPRNAPSQSENATSWYGLPPQWGPFGRRTPPPGPPGPHWGGGHPHHPPHHRHGWAWGPGGPPRGPHGPGVPPPPPGAPGIPPPPPGVPGAPRPPGAPPVPPPAPRPPRAGPMLRSSSGEAQSTPQEMRAQVDAARAQYKLEKEKYRQEREVRRRERDRKLNSGGETTEDSTDKDVKKADVSMDSMDSSTSAPQVPATPTITVEPLKFNPPPGPPPMTQIVSNARGPYPQLEMFSVPRRSNTFSGPSPRRHGQRHSMSESVESRTIQRITRRLGDMGFTENAYPSLPSKIRSQMPTNGVLTKDGEDDVVTNLLEELLAMSPKGPTASGSGLKKENPKDIPGAWQ